MASTWNGDAKALDIARGDHDAYARQALENFNFLRYPDVAIAHIDEALGVYSAIDGGCMSPALCLQLRRLGRDHPAGRGGIPLRCRAQPFLHRDDQPVVCGISFGCGPRAQGEQYRAGRATIADPVMFIGN